MWRKERGSLVGRHFGRLVVKCFGNRRSLESGAPIHHRSEQRMWTVDPPSFASFNSSSTVWDVCDVQKRETSEALEPRSSKALDKCLTVSAGSQPLVT
jgi:hypothetical protein